MPLREELFLKDLLHTFLLAGFFYANAYLLIPNLLTKGKVPVYFLTIACIIGMIVLINFYFRQFLEIDYRPLPEHSNLPKHFSGNRDLRRLTRALFSSLFIFAVSTSYKLLLDWFKSEREKKEIENQHLSSELAFLKSQVSPHFLFNTLNNIYSLSLSQSDLTSNSILKLSQMLRYMLYESDVKQVGLDKEVEYLQNYIELQKMRISEGIKITFTTFGKLSENRIEPMLLIPFIENAFKHGINYSKKTEILIDLKLSENVLVLKVENHIYQTNEKDKASGIGLTNVKRRLSLLYPGNHLLTAEEKADKYLVELKITLKK
jgi:sensor histidine kinase YesM